MKNFIVDDCFPPTMNEVEQSELNDTMPKNDGHLLNINRIELSTQENYLQTIQKLQELNETLKANVAALYAENAKANVVKITECDKCRQQGNQKNIELSIAADFLLTKTKNKLSEEHYLNKIEKLQRKNTVLSKKIERQKRLVSQLSFNLKSAAEKIRDLTKANDENFTQYKSNIEPKSIIGIKSQVVQQSREDTRKVFQDQLKMIRNELQSLNNLVSKNEALQDANKLRLTRNYGEENTLRNSYLEKQNTHFGGLLWAIKQFSWSDSCHKNNTDEKRGFKNLCRIDGEEGSLKSSDLSFNNDDVIDFSSQGQLIDNKKIVEEESHYLELSKIESKDRTLGDSYQKILSNDPFKQNRFYSEKIKLHEDERAQPNIKVLGVINNLDILNSSAREPLSFVKRDEDFYNDENFKSKTMTRNHSDQSNSGNIRVSDMNYEGKTIDHAASETASVKSQKLNIDRNSVESCDECQSNVPLSKKNQFKGNDEKRNCYFSEIFVEVPISETHTIDVDKEVLHDLRPSEHCREKSFYSKDEQSKNQDIAQAHHTFNSSHTICSKNNLFTAENSEASLKLPVEDSDDLKKKGSAELQELTSSNKIDSSTTTPNSATKVKSTILQHAASELVSSKTLESVKTEHEMPSDVFVNLVACHPEDFQASDFQKSSANPSPDFKKGCRKISFDSKDEQIGDNLFKSHNLFCSDKNFSTVDSLEASKLPPEDNPSNQMQNASATSTPDEDLTSKGKINLLYARTLATDTKVKSPVLGHAASELESSKTADKFGIEPVIPSEIMVNFVTHHPIEFQTTAFLSSSVEPSIFITPSDATENCEEKSLQSRNGNEDNDQSLFSSDSNHITCLSNNLFAHKDLETSQMVQEEDDNQMQSSMTSTNNELHGVTSLNNTNLMSATSLSSDTNINSVILGCETSELVPQKRSHKDENGPPIPSNILLNGVTHHPEEFQAIDFQKDLTESYLSTADTTTFKNELSQDEELFNHCGLKSFYSKDVTYCNQEKDAALSIKNPSHLFLSDYSHSNFETLEASLILSTERNQIQNASLMSAPVRRQRAFSNNVNVIGTTTLSSDVKVNSSSSEVAFELSLQKYSNIVDSEHEIPSNTLINNVTHHSEVFQQRDFPHFNTEVLNTASNPIAAVTEKRSDHTLSDNVEANIVPDKSYDNSRDLSKVNELLTYSNTPNTLNDFALKQSITQKRSLYKSTSKTSNTNLESLYRTQSTHPATERNLKTCSLSRPQLFYHQDNESITDMVETSGDFDHLVTCSIKSAGRIVLISNDGIHFIPPQKPSIPHTSNRKDVPIYRKGHKDGYYLYKSSTGNEYIGYWRNGKRNGYGMAKYRNGDIYSGQWRKGLRYGHGTLHLANKEVFDGSWNSNQKHGIGTYFWVDGDVDISWYQNDRRIKSIRWTKDRCCSYRLDLVSSRKDQISLQQAADTVKQWALNDKIV